MVKIEDYSILNLIVMLLLKDLKVSTLTLSSLNLGVLPLPPLPLNTDDQCYCSGAFDSVGLS